MPEDKAPSEETSAPATRPVIAEGATASAETPILKPAAPAKKPRARVKPNSRQRSAAVNLGVYNKPGQNGVSATELIAVALTALWLGLVVVFYVFADTDSTDGSTGSLTLIMTLLAIFLPIAVIWIGAVAARSARIMRSESTRLQAAIDGMRQTYVAQIQSTGTGTKPTVEQKLDQIAAAQKETETALARFTASHLAGSGALPAVALAPAPQPPANHHGQTALELGTPAEALKMPISVSDFIRALNFPENIDDHEGFAALRHALQDRRSARLVQASQDILTLLSQEGIYMDDLRQEKVPAEYWRHFASGARGESIARLGGVRDRSSLTLSAGRMRQDPVFRDAVHHFIRQFDESFVEFAKNASDDDILAFSDTRTARAFMLLGRVAGMFD